ncbi:ribosomal protein S5 domain 2-like protein [Stereum hirsutum FP-91666 SS1]|uniref:ribosomal protein S5 domain 2-like protein n=1 Tax=Stereum hirsutum (strain FP-91666) TaxID=721885 RepID=UPI0004449A7C|nr:ribosomal protein S5 domain 2-like protein [Stereum hirsutum FP-91666 SS1]EIM80595.1 ribosomal protein S5 domain 2-like protein [Stereum hirsutum FP-91666 SS1]
MQTSLESFVTSSYIPPPLPIPLATSTIIEDRQSTFQATLFRARTATEARTAINHLRRVIHRSNPASHEIAAWRCMVLRQGRTGLGEDDFMLVEGSEDDNEKWAGAKVLGVMKSLAVLDTVVVVSRWYGGVMLGPVRFTHIEDCTRQVCNQVIVKDEIDDSIATLTNLDSTLAALRIELDALRQRPPSPPPSALPAAPDDLSTSNAHDYSTLLKDLDVKKARRLITARENAIKSVKTLVMKEKEKQRDGVDLGGGGMKNVVARVDEGG